MYAGVYKKFDYIELAYFKYDLLQASFHRAKHNLLHDERRQTGGR